MGGEDREAPDPFRVRLQFGWLDWVRMVLLGVTLAPLRVRPPSLPGLAPLGVWESTPVYGRHGFVTMVAQV